jgi:hypothetical protein
MNMPSDVASIVKVSFFVNMIRLAITFTFMLTACSIGQDRGGTPPGDGRMLIGGVFSKAQASGSLEYWGVCNFKELYPDFPKLRAVSSQEGQEGSVLESLREMFSADPEMRVSRDTDGKIRMIEDDVPTDLLDVKIQHLKWLAGSHGPNMAVRAILISPEVIAFRREHDIGPESEWGTSVPATNDALAVNKPSVWGDLYGVTVRQALDYILATFQGFWLYENCKNPEGGRTIHLGFIENAPGTKSPGRTQK